MIRIRNIALVGFMLLACWGLLAPAATRADTLNGTISVDNVFNFFLGDSTGSNLRFIGLGGDWQSPVTFTDVACQPGDYIYVAGWDQGGPQMFLAQFTLAGGTLLTNTSDWLSYQSSNSNPGGSVELATSQIQGDIVEATWGAPVDLGVNLSHPTWGTLSAIDSTARFIWHAGYIEDPYYVLFRSKDIVCEASPVPIPSALPLFGSGLLLLGVWGAGRKFL